MKFRFPTVILAFVVLLPAAHSANRQYAPGRILSVREHTRDRVLLYQVNTPILAEDPYVTIALEVNGRVYDAEFLPRNHQEIFPGFWKADERVLLRLDKHFVYLKGEDGSEAKFLITAKPRLQSARESH
jgi:hypothetical protein